MPQLAALLAPSPVAPPQDPATARLQPHTVHLSLNGEAVEARVRPRVTLLDWLRDDRGLTGAKKGCNEGACGACTVLLNGQRVNACLTLVVQCEGSSVTTIEGLAPGDAPLHPVQQAFIDHDALQCGYCTPGQVLSAVACIAEGHAGDAAEVREWMSGNLCRCACYPQIVEAVLDAAQRMAAAEPATGSASAPCGD